MKHSDKKIELQRANRKVASRLKTIEKNIEAANLQSMVSTRAELSDLWLDSQNILFSSRIAAMQDVEDLAYMSYKRASRIKRTLESSISGFVETWVDEENRKFLDHLTQRLTTIIPCETAQARLSAISQGSKVVPVLAVTFTNATDKRGNEVPKYGVWASFDARLTSTFDDYPSCPMTEWVKAGKPVKTGVLLDIMERDGLKVKT